jgi:hypothetical protein
MYLVRTLDTKVKILENIYKMLSESRMMYGIEVWSLDGEEEIDKIQRIFCMQIIRMPKGAANSQVMKRM